MKMLYGILIQLACATFSHAGDKIKADAEWLRLKYDQLAAVTNVEKVLNVGLRPSGSKDARGAYTYYPQSGRIVFDDGSWVLLVSHSIHAEDGLGDMTLVRTSEGNYFVTRGHVCEKLILETKEKIASLGTFLRAKGKGAKAEPIPWEPYEGEQDGGEVRLPAARSTSPHR